jgi:BASS family bile acid:Na+ symporter
MLLLVLALIDVYQTVIDAGMRVGAAIVVATLLALAAGHALGGPEPTTRTSTAISSGARNAGLAVLVAALNNAPTGIVATVLAYLVLSAFTVLAYAIWRRRKTEPAVT